MEKLAENQICEICEEVIPSVMLEVNLTFDISRCKPCLNRYGPVPLETIKASLISVHGLNVKDIPKEKWHELILLQKKKWELKQETEKKIDKIKGSILSIGRDNKIEKVKQEAAEERKKISQDIENLIMGIKKQISDSKEGSV